MGDYGTQFGKLIEGYKKWGEEYNIEENPIDELTKIYVRINQLCKEDESVLEACRDNFKKLEDVDFNELNQENAIEVIKLLYGFGDAIKQAAEKNEPYIIARYLINLAKAFSIFYNNYKIITEDEKKQDARLYLTYCVNNVLKNGANLLGMKMPERM